MKFSIPSILVSLFLIAVSCNSSEKKHVHQSSESTQIVLDHGNKWKVNTEMMVHIIHLENEISSFNSSDYNAYQSLVVVLQSDIEKLTSSCTMKGESHDQLHLWLLPFIDQVKSLKKAIDSESSAQLLSEIKVSLSTFHTYFE